MKNRQSVTETENNPQSAIRNPQWKIFGWQGITCEIPSEWELSGLSGDHKDGYLRLDDTVMPRMELKWSRSKKKKPDLQSILDNYFKSVRKTYEKNKRLNISRDVNLISEEEFFENRTTVSFFHWKGDIRAFGAIWHCSECKRIVVVQIIGQLKEKIRDMVISIITSLKDHPSGHSSYWNVYSLPVEIPRRYNLDKHKLMSGYILLSFVDGSRKLAVERYGMVDILLKGKSIEDWFRESYAKEMKKYGFSINHLSDSSDVDNKFELVGEKTRIVDRIPFASFQFIDKIMRRQNLAAYIWHCRKSNRIFVVRCIAKRNALETASEVEKSVKCHQAL
jgi:hypothetical protein